MTTVIYDVTRIVNYIAWSKPSGIERVDINYLHGALSETNRTVIGVIEIHGKDGENHLISLSKSLTEKIAKHLYRKWTGAPYDETEFNENAKYCPEKLRKK
jgi:hypothetical protein